MSWPASSTWPPRLAPCTISCIRLSMRRKVDLPQPEGPIRAVTDPASIRSDTRSSTLCAPNQADTLRASSPIRELAVMTALLRPPGSSMAVSGMTVSGWSGGPDQAIRRRIADDVCAVANGRYAVRGRSLAGDDLDDVSRSQLPDARERGTEGRPAPEDLRDASLTGQRGIAQVPGAEGEVLRAGALHHHHVVHPDGRYAQDGDRDARSGERGSGAGGGGGPGGGGGGPPRGDLVGPLPLGPPGQNGLTPCLLHPR